MPSNAYIISEVEIVDADAGERYRTLAAQSIAAHGGRYIVRGAEPTMLEGQRPGAQRVVVVEFDDVHAARAWYASPEYAPALALAREGDALRRRLTLVAGYGVKS
jgi:uncharacterized protein (DUF1330 family)